MAAGRPCEVIGSTPLPRGCGDVAFTAARLSIRDLAFRGPPVPLPPIDEFPAIGYLTEAEIGTAGRPWGG